MNRSNPPPVNEEKMGSAQPESEHQITIEEWLDMMTSEWAETREAIKKEE